MMTERVACFAVLAFFHLFWQVECSLFSCSDSFQFAFCSGQFDLAKCYGDAQKPECITGKKKYI